MVSNGLVESRTTAPTEALAALRAACKSTGTLLVSDEIQTFGWLGTGLFVTQIDRSPARAVLTVRHDDSRVRPGHLLHEVVEPAALVERAIVVEHRSDQVGRRTAVVLNLNGPISARARSAS